MRSTANTPTADRRPRAGRRNLLRTAGAAVALGLVTTSCLFGGGGRDGGSISGATALNLEPTESGMPADPKPQRGGELVYGLEAEAEKGYCLPESQLAISGIQVARSLFDTLAIPDAKGGYAPYLAKTIDHSKDYKTWTITLRSGVKFHDGSALTADVVKDNLDAYRGKFPGRSPLLFTFVLNNVDTVSVVNGLTVQVTTKVPWVAFPSVLYNSGRFGIVAEAQLKASPSDCEARPIGTGPFSFVSWDKGSSLKVRRNPSYWQKAPDGKPYPYLNGIDFRPLPNSDERVAALRQGELNMMHTSTATDMAKSLASLRDEGTINLMVSSERTETQYLMLNSSKPPFTTHRGRVAVAQALDRRQVNAESNAGFATLADGPFAPGVLGHLDNPGYPKFDPAAAKAAVAAMKADGERTSLTMVTTTSPVSLRLATIEKRMLERAGFTINLQVTEQSRLITQAITGEFDLMAFRNQPGEDPDADRVWWYGGSNPVNFGRFNDPVINKAFDTARSTANPKVRAKAYQTINRQFAKEAYNAWLWYAPWAVAEAANVHGIVGPDLPGGGGPAPKRLVLGHSLLGIWIDRG